jgi:hypothetical protein
MRLFAFVFPLVVLAVVAYVDGHLLPLWKVRRERERTRKRALAYRGADTARGSVRRHERAA